MLVSGTQALRWRFWIEWQSVIQSWAHQICSSFHGNKDKYPKLSRNFNINGAKAAHHLISAKDNQLNVHAISSSKKKMEITTMFAMFSWFQIQFSSFNKRWVEKKPDGKGENWEKRNTHLTQILSFLFAISLSYETLQSNFFDLQQQYSGLDFHITFPSFWKWIPTTHIMGYWLRKMKLQLKLFQNLCSTKI